MNTRRFVTDLVVLFLLASALAYGAVTYVDTFVGVGLYAGALALYVAFGVALFHRLMRNES